MNSSPNYKAKQFFWLILKIGIVFGCLYFIYLKLFKNEQISFVDFWQIIKENHINSTKNLFILLCFSFMNWFFEILKWKKIVSSFEKITFSEASKQSFSSLVVSLITPNRVGEYPAKAVFYRPLKRKLIIALNFIHNSFQLLTTILFGFLGALFFIYFDYFSLSFQPYYTLFFFGIILFFGTAVKLKRISYIRIGVEKSILFWRQIPEKIKIKTFLFSILRYIVFSHQFYFLLLIFNIEINYLQAISGVSLMYLIASVIPFLSLFDVVLKSAVAVFVFSFFDVDELKIVSTTLLMWIFNFVLPALIGSYFVLRFKPKINT